MKAEEARALAKSFKNDDTEKVLKKMRAAAVAGDLSISTDQPQGIPINQLTESVRKDLADLGYGLTELAGGVWRIEW